MGGWLGGMVGVGVLVLCVLAMRWALTSRGRWVLDNRSRVIQHLDRQACRKPWLWCRPWLRPGAQWRCGACGTLWQVHEMYGDCRWSVVREKLTRTLDSADALDILRGDLGPILLVPQRLVRALSPQLQERGYQFTAHNNDGEIWRRY